jgi:outer membrane lipoprotein carrier protein
MAEEPSARAVLEAFATDLQTLSASFEQSIVGPEGAVESSGTGQVWLSRPGLFRWSYDGEFPEIIVADGETVWMHDVVMEQVTVKPQSMLAQDSPLTVLTGISTLDEQFLVRELGAHEGLKLLELTSRSPDSEFDRVLLGMDQASLRLMVMEDAFGLRTELRFSQVERNPGLDPGLFHFEPPSGVDIIGESAVAD